MSNHRSAICGATIVAGAALFIGLLAPPVQAGDDFGEHVQTCAHVMGFDADHNPGMHQGYHGWSPDHTC